MALTVTISTLPETGVLQNNSFIPIETNNVTQKITGATLKSFISSLTTINATTGNFSGAITADRGTIANNFSIGRTLMVNGAAQISGNSSALGVRYAGAQNQYGLALKADVDGTSAIGFFNAASQAVGRINQNATGIQILGLTGGLTMSGDLSVTGSGVFTGKLTAGARVIATGGNGNDYNNGSLEVYGGGPGSPGIFPVIGFHNPGVFAGSLRQNNPSDFGFYTQGGSTTANLSVSGLFADNAVYARNGFLTTNYLLNQRNPIWRFNDSQEYGISYFQGTSGFEGRDSIGVHFGAESGGSATGAGSQIKFTPDGRVVARRFQGLADSSSFLKVTDADEVGEPGDRGLAHITPQSLVRSIRADFATGAGTGSLYSGILTFSPYDGRTASTGGPSYQLAFGSTQNNGGSPRLRIRNGIDNTWNDWVDVRTTSNASDLQGTSLPANIINSSLRTVGTLQNLTVSGPILPTANVSIDIGSTTSWFRTIYGTSVQAQYADLAEVYSSDVAYEPGQVLVFGGDAEVTLSTRANDRTVAGVVSTHPAYLMNAFSNGAAIALQGRVPCFVTGDVKLGDMMVTSDIPGVAMASADPKLGSVIGKALASHTGYEVGLIEVAVGRL